jgi:hypothetical protein
LASLATTHCRSAFPCLAGARQAAWLVLERYAELDGNSYLSLLGPVSRWLQGTASLAATLLQR